MREIKHTVDLCVVGGGMAGICTALAAARHGSRVALVQGRPVIEPVGAPHALIRSFHVEAQDNADSWKVIARQDDNHQRLVRLDCNIQTRALRFIPESTWGARRAHLFAWDIDDKIYDRGR